jgi:elongation factor Ts
MSVSIERIKELRERTGAGILDCREALEASEGDLEKAAEVLRQKGFEEAAKRADRETNYGVLDLYNHGDGRVGVMVEVNCETDFVARTEAFREFAHEIALQVAATAPEYVQVEDIPVEVIEAQKEKLREQALREGKPEHVVGRIVEGRMDKFYEEACLLRQPYVREDSMTVEELWKETIASVGENITIRRFARWEVGEEIE